ncbi:MAG: polysaccharide deacetylase family protein [Euryarchaeota archaeon]|nr:polysaccharide deacetylase family protein [Euryarchaeota archaeon]
MTEKPLIHLLLTFDVEEYEYFGDLNGKIERIMNILNGFPATFFLDAETALRYPESIKLLSENGFELAVHSDFHFGYGTQQNPKILHFLHETQTQITRIQNAISMIREIIPNFDPKGFRAPNMLWNEALYISLKKLDFFYDSSQKEFNFQPFLKNDIVVFPMNCGDFDSAAYKIGVRSVLLAWMRRFDCACRSAINTGESYFLLLMHPTCVGRAGYILMLKAMLNYITRKDTQIKFQTCIEATNEYKQKILKGDISEYFLNKNKKEPLKNEKGGDKMYIWICSTCKHAHTNFVARCLACGGKLVFKRLEEAQKLAFVASK